jgi:hypothetical protein
MMTLIYGYAMKEIFLALASARYFATEMKFAINVYKQRARGVAAAAVA